MCVCVCVSRYMCMEVCIDNKLVRQIGPFKQKFLTPLLKNIMVKFV